MTTRRYVVISGCSGGGKSTLLDEMARRGHQTIPEPGRRIVADELRTGGESLPWSNPRAFALKAIEMAIADVEAAPQGTVLFDRCALDALNWFDQTGEALDGAIRRRVLSLGYDQTVFLVPPWPEIYQTDAERHHGFETALAEYLSLCERLPRYGYTVSEIPKASVSARADWLEARLGV